MSTDARGWFGLISAATTAGVAISNSAARPTPEGHRLSHIAGLLLRQWNRPGVAGQLTSQTPRRFDAAQRPDVPE